MGSFVDVETCHIFFPDLVSKVYLKAYWSCDWDTEFPVFINSLLVSRLVSASVPQRCLSSYSGTCSPPTAFCSSADLQSCAVDVGQLKPSKAAPQLASMAGSGSSLGSSPQDGTFQHLRAGILSFFCTMINPLFSEEYSLRPKILWSSLAL